MDMDMMSGYGHVAWKWTCYMDIYSCLDLATNLDTDTDSDTDADTDTGTDIYTDIYTDI